MIFNKGDILKSWIDPRVVTKTSSIHGQGMFAKRQISGGEIVVIWGGIVYDISDIQSGIVKLDTVVVLSEGQYLGDPADNGIDYDYYLNHSCDPNTWMQDEITIIANKDIKEGEELTIDYAVWETNTAWKIISCKCGSKICRGHITGMDWKLQELQLRYKDHFIPFLNRKILQQNKIE